MIKCYLLEVKKFILNSIVRSRIIIAWEIFMRIPIKVQWDQLCDTIKKLELEIAQTDVPIPTPQMCKLLIVGEDHRFYEHPGVDLLALCRAFWKTFFCGERQGGSTIAMQFVRTITSRYEKTWQRKLLEIVFAVRLTRYLPKDRLPTLYLWVAYYGWGMNDFTQACARLKIDPKTVSVFEAAQLVARLKYPEPRECSPKHLEKIQRRGHHLITLANKMGESLKPYQEIQNETV